MMGDRAVSPTTRLRLRHDSMDVEVGSCPVSLSAELSPLFADMPMSDCEKVVSTAFVSTSRRRHTIFFAGDPIKEILLLTEGSVKITQLGEDGSAVILRLEGPGGGLGSLGAAGWHEH